MAPAYRTLAAPAKAPLPAVPAVDLPLSLASIRSAFANQELWLAYQPLLRLADGALVGCEALLRWTHPLRGAQEPRQFLPILWRSPLMLDVGDWALEQAATQVAAWRKLSGLDLRLGVNLAPLQVCAADAAARVAAALEASGLPRNRLSLDITQDLLVENAAGAERALRQFAALGVEIYLDDFSGGPSALNHMRALQLRGCKIDRRFLDGLADPALFAELEALLGLAGQHGLRVIAESVEQESELAALGALGVIEAQGYALCAPLSAAGFGNYLAAYRVRGD